MSEATTLDIPEIYPKMKRKCTIFISDYKLTKDFKKDTIQPLIHGKCHSFGPNFMNRTLEDIIISDPDASAYWLYINDPLVRSWLSTSIIEVRKIANIVITPKSSSKSDWITNLRVYTNKTIKKKDLLMLNEITDRDTGELIQCIHMKKPEGLIKTIFRWLFRILGKKC